MLNVNVINAKNTQKVEVKPGQPANLKVDPNTRFELVDSASGKAPAQIKARRVGDNLEIVTDEKAQIEDEAVSNAQTPDLVLENYYKQEDVSLFAGEGEQAVSYVPVDGVASASYAAMNTSATTGAAVAALPLLSPWMGVAAGAGLAVAGGGSGGSSTTQVTNKAPVAKDDVKSVEQNKTLTAVVPSATDPDGSVVRYEVTENVKITDGILRFNSNGTYTFNPSGFDYLAEGEKATVTFKYVAIDGFGARSEPQTVTITMIGKNDAPEIVAVESGGKVDNFATLIVENNHGISTSSTLTIKDKDLSDTVIYQKSPLNVNFKGTTYFDFDNYAGKTDLVDYVMGLLKLDSSPGARVNDPHNLKWTFSYEDEGASVFDLIPEGETLFLNYTIQVEDAQKVIDNKVITVSILGTNDALVIFLESGDSAEGTIVNNLNPIISGTLSVFDFDKVKTLTAEVAGVKLFNVVGASATEIDVTNLDLKSMLQIRGTFSDKSEYHNLTWKFVGDASKADGLVSGASYTLSYDIAISDIETLTSHQTVNIHFQL
jgi:VCBS repeat-containing protein